MAKGLKGELMGTKIPVIPASLNPSNSPDVYRGDLFNQWMSSKKGKDLKELIELENLLWLMKGDGKNQVWMKLIKNQQLSAYDFRFIDTFIKLMLEIHKLKYGEKHTNINVGYKDIQEMMFGNVQKEDKKEEQTAPPIQQ